MVNFEADNAVLDGFTIDTNGGDRAIAPRDSDGTVITNSKIVNSYRGVQGDYHGRPTNLEVRNTVFETDYGIAGTEDVTGLVVEDNTFHTTEEAIGLGEGVEIESITGNEFLGTGDHVRDYRDPADSSQMASIVEDNDFDRLVRVINNQDQLAAPNLTASIQTAVDEADTGDTVEVGPGTYSEIVDTPDTYADWIDTGVAIEKNITLVGNDAVIDLEGEGSTIGITFGPDAGEPRAEGFTVEGWTVGGIGQGHAASDGTAPQIVDNTIIAPDEVSAHGNSIQVTGDDALVEGNEITVALLVEEPGTPHTEWDGTGILVYGGEGTEVTNNHITGYDRAIGITGGDEIGDSQTSPARDVLVSGNVMEGTKIGVDITKDANRTVVTDNEFTGHETAFRQAIAEGYDDEFYKPGETELTGNTFENNDLQVASFDEEGEYAPAGSINADGDIGEQNEFDNFVRSGDTPVGFSSIQDAIDNTDVPQPVFVFPGTYEGDITIDTDGVVVVAPGDPDETTIEGMVNFEADNAGLVGFTIDTDGGDRAIAPRDSNGTVIANSKIVNSYRGVQGDYHGKPTNLVILSTVFETDYGIAGTEDVTGLVVEGNTFHTAEEGIGLGEGVEIESITGNEFLGTGDHVRDYREPANSSQIASVAEDNEFDRIVRVLKSPDDFDSLGELAAPLLTADIQTAIDSAGENDIVYAGPGTYEGDITITTDGVEVVADGPDETTIEGMVNFEADNAALYGFTIDTDGGDRAIAPRDSDGTVIANSKIVNAFRGVQGDYHGRPTNLEIRDTVFETDYGLAGTEDVTGLVVEDNIFHTAEEGIGLGEGVEIESITENEFLGTGDHVRDYRDLDEYDELGELSVENEFDKLVGVFDEDDDILAAPLLTTSIQTAVDEADTGETVYVGNGTYEEQVVINENLSIIGEPGATVQAPPQEERTVFKIPEVDGDDDPRTIDAVLFAYGGDSEEGVVDGDETIDVTISGLEIDGMDQTFDEGTYFGVGLRNVDGSVEHNVIDGMTTGSDETGGIGVHGDSDVDVIGNEVHQYERIGIVAVGNYTEGPHPTATIANNYVAGPGEPVDGWAPNGIQIGWGASGEIIDNTVTGNTHESGEPGAIIAAGSEDVLIYNNTVFENHDGIQVYGDAWWGSGLEAENITIINNTVTSSVNGVSIGPDSNDVFVSNNEISENDLGVELWGGVDPTEIELIRNDIVGNDIGVLNPTEEPLVAPLNYWGEAEGGAGGPQAVENNSVEGNVVYDPFLTVSIDELEEEDVWTTQQFANDLHIPNDGNTYAVGFPGPTDQTVGEAFSSFTGTIWAYDADDGWSQASNDDDIDALDAFVVVLDDDEADAVVAVEYAEGDATGLPESTTIRPGFNLLPSAALGDATTGFNGPDSSEVLYGLYEFPHGQPLDTQGVDEPHGVIATSEDDFADVTVTPFGGYLMFTGEERSITTFVEAGVTASEIDSRLDRED